MSPLLTRRFRLLTLVLLLAAVAGGCGGNEAKPSHADTDVIDVSILDARAVSQPSDSSISSLSLTASVEYDAGTDTVELFTIARDQDGTPLFFFNKYNFAVTLNPKSSDFVVDKGDSSYSLATSAGSALEEDRVVSLILDVSGSMAGSSVAGGLSKLEEAKAAASTFVDGMQAGDLTALVSFSDIAQIEQQLTGDTPLLRARIGALETKGATNIGGAITQAVNAVGTRPGKRAVILLTDGGGTVDPTSWFVTSTLSPTNWIGNLESTRWNAVLLAKESDLRVYTIGFGLDEAAEDGKNAINDLKTIADRTGGKFFLATTGTELTDVLQHQIPAEVAALEPLSTYILRFTNPLPATGRKPVPLLLGLTFQNARGVLYTKTSGTYTVE